MMPALNKLLAPLRQRVGNLFARGVLRLIDSAGGAQKLQVEMQPGELLNNVEHLEPYGFTSRPFAGAEVAGLSVGGDRNRIVVVMVADRRYRLKALAAGEMAIYDDQGQKVHLKRNGIYIEAAGTVEIKGTLTAAVKGIVQGDCLCAYTGALHPMISSNVKGSI